MTRNTLERGTSTHNFLYSPYMADRWGRKLPIIIGCLLMIMGGFLGAFCKDYGSTCLLLG